MDRDKLFEEPARRRWWLLVKALECTSTLDRALDLARTADQFVLAETCANADLRMPAAAVLTPPVEPRSRTKRDRPVAEDNAVSIGRKETSRLSLSQNRRDALLDRLARGEKNADIAADFGLTPRQVQGIRMSRARLSGLRREAELPRDKPQAVFGSVEEVVRYLRQQDDVVVPDGNGRFLVNGRFNLSLSELVDKANRMRSRQRKPFFKMNGPSLPIEEMNRRWNVNGHSQEPVTSANGAHTKLGRSQT
jgi:hypothetical protein